MNPPCDLVEPRKAVGDFAEVFPVLNALEAPFPFLPQVGNFGFFLSIGVHGNSRSATCSGPDNSA